MFPSPLPITMGASFLETRIPSRSEKIAAIAHDPSNWEITLENASRWSLSADWDLSS